MSPKPVKSEEAVGIGPNKELWSKRALLRDRRGHNFEGRVFVEVWDEDAHLVVGEDNPALWAKALETLEGEFSPIVSPETPLTDEPATGAQEAQAFLGRVVVEVWEDQSLVGLTGSDPRVVERAVEMLAKRLQE